VRPLESRHLHIKKEGRESEGQRYIHIT
jgi:hypothetical protein